MPETQNTERNVVWSTDGPEDTIRFAASLATACRPCDVLGLCGTLGAGKTTLVKGLARGLGVGEDRRVISPTFVLMRSYSGRLPLYHFDAYRLSGGAEMEAIGAEETFEAGGVTVVEWADHVAECLPPSHFLLHIQVKGAEQRRFEMEAVGDRAAGRVQEFATAAADWLVTPA